MKETVRAEFKISGLVQGVGYRYFVYRIATQFGLNGYAKNCYDGSVEVVVEGEKQNIGEFHTYLLQGPQLSHVKSCKVIYGTPTGEFFQFSIR
ncbi:MAG: acylphosphatase [Ignavibacteria bacterium]|nr:acylphosphatase [Ignavibacteria bacterium]